MKQIPGIYYEPDGYQTGGKRLLGRQAAGEGFLKGFIQYSTFERIGCVTRNHENFMAFCRQVEPWCTRPRQITRFPIENLKNITDMGVYYRPDPLISEMAWQRRYGDPRAYSLCGVTHTIVSKATQKGIGDLLLAPLNPWDAVICPSQAVKQAIEKILEDWADYLYERMGARPQWHCQLPVIPLGIDSAIFPNINRQADVRAALRQQMNIPQDEIVVLFVGRLVSYAKAHPVPMYLALERVMQRVGLPIHFVQAGWFENKQEEQAFQSAAKRFCPSVHCLFIDGRSSEMRSTLWSMADIFLSLSDNVQETFGLTPLEAMANGLPVIVSDWDGYRETVRHNVDGFRIPTIMPTEPHGDDYTEAYLTDKASYGNFIGNAAMATAVDIDACVQALTALILNPDFRRQMGETARKQACTTYDWRVIIPQYEALWRELQDIRHSTTTEPTAPRKAGQPAYPLLSSPFRPFKHYATHLLTSETVVALHPEIPLDILEKLDQDWTTSLGRESRPSSKEMAGILAWLRQHGPCSVGEIEQAQKECNFSPNMTPTLLYLMKWGMLTLIADAEAREGSPGSTSADFIQGTAR